MIRMIPCFLLLALAFAAIHGVSGGFWSSSNAKKDEAEEVVPVPPAVNHARSLTEWFRKTDATFLHPGLEIRPKSGDDPRLGVFATMEIPSGDMILSVPRTLYLSPTVPQVGDHVEALTPEGEEIISGTVTELKVSDGTYTVETAEGELVHGITLESIRHEDNGVNCGAVRRLLQEMDFGEQSLFAPYVEFMKHSVSAGSVPSAWSPQGKALLQDVLGKGEDGKEILPPVAATNFLEEFWVKVCNGKADDAKEEAAFHLSLQRVFGEHFVPVFDLLGHRNGIHTNAHHTAVHGEEPLAVYASRDLEEGEEILISYNFCEECGSRRLNYGTPELLRDYGFVEEYPQRWTFYFASHDPIVFDIEEDHDKENEPVVRWSAQFRFPTETGDVEFFAEQAARLEALGKSLLSENDKNVPDHEWKVITEYHQALLTALKLGGESIKEGLAAGEFEVMDTPEQLEEEEARHEEEDGEEREGEEEEEEESEYQDEEFFDEEEEEEL